MKNVSQIFKLLAAVLTGATFISSIALAQQTNPKKLPLCPKPDYSKKDWDQVSHWTNCWGLYEQREQHNYPEDSLGSFYTKNKTNIYEGEWQKGELQHGLLIAWSGARYTGQFKNNRPNGDGVNVGMNGEIREGKFKDSIFLKGKIQYNNGDTYIGEALNGLREGSGQYIFANGDKFVGNWSFNKREGKGTYYYLSNSPFRGDIFEGFYVDDQRNGPGMLTKADGKKYFRHWKDGEIIFEAFYFKPKPDFGFSE